jgi:hypothetical protein
MDVGIYVSWGLLPIVGKTYIALGKHDWWPHQFDGVFKYDDGLVVNIDSYVVFPGASLECHYPQEELPAYLAIYAEDVAHAGAP